MLARANRVVRADDYRNTVRRGRKSAAAHCVVYQRFSDTPDSGAETSERGDGVAGVRFGFIVSKAVGNAVARNTVRRRLKGVAHELLPELEKRRLPLERTDIVIRALPGSIEVPWSTLLEEITGAIDKGAQVDKRARV